MAAPRQNLLARSSDYRKLWTAATISLFGTQVSLIAIPVIAIFLLHVAGLPGRPARDGRVPAVPALHPACGGVGGPVAAPVDPRRRRLRPGDLAPVDPDRLGAGRADDLAALPGRVHQRDAHGLLRRRRPVVPAGDPRAGRPHRGQLEAPGQRLGRPGPRPAARRRDRRPVRGAARGHRRRDQLRRLRRSDLLDPQARAEAGRGGGRDGRAPRPGCGDPVRDRRGAPLRPRPPVPALHRGQHWDLEPVLEHRLRDDRVLRVHRPRADPVPVRGDRRPREHRGARRRARGRPDRRADRGRPDDPLVDDHLRARRRSSPPPPSRRRRCPS